MQENPKRKMNGPPSPFKARQVRVYLKEADAEILDELSKVTGMRDTLIASIVIAAGLEAVQKFGFEKVPLHLKFTVKTK